MKEYFFHKKIILAINHNILSERMKADDEETQIKGAEMRRIFKFYTRRCTFYCAVFVAFLAGVTPTVANILMGRLTLALINSDQDTIIENVKNPIYFLAGFAVVIFLEYRCLFILIGFSNPWFMSDIRTTIYKKLLFVEMDYFDERQTGTLISRLTFDCSLMNEVYITKFTQAVTNLTMAASGVILAFSVDWLVTVAVIAAIPICIAIFIIGEHIVGSKWDSYNEFTSKAATKAEEALNAFRIVKSFDNELYEADKYRKSLGVVNDIMVNISRIKGIKESLIHFTMFVMNMGIHLFGSNRVIYHNSTTDNVVALGFGLVFAVIGLSQSLSIANDFKKARVSASKVLDILEREIKVDQRKGDNPDTKLTGKIEFKDVYFKYKNRDEYAVKGLSFTIEAGETVAFIGESGCGKSTTLQLIQRFYDIEKGEILLDGVNIYSLSPHFLRKNIISVPQGPVLFSMSIKDNIRYGMPDADDKAISDAATIGNAHDFIMSLPNNYRTQVEPTSLSGGQKQRVCISRAVLVDAPVLLLDEATAALDTQSERLVQQSLERIRKGKTAIMVAHRLATVKNADKIFVFKDGAVTETGTHSELLAKGGIYHDLIRFQLQ